MLADTFHDVALRLPEATFDVKWGVDRVYCVGGKMFATAGQLDDPTPRYMFKASEMSFELLVDQGVARPAPYLARASWVQLLAHDSLPEAELQAYLAQAHALVAASLTRKTRTALGLPV